MPNRFGRQPAQQLLHDHRWPVARAARELGELQTHLYNAITGRCAPSPLVRERLPQLLGMPLEELFTPEALAADYDGPRGRHHLVAGESRCAGS